MNTRLQTHTEHDRSEMLEIKRHLAALWDEVRSYFQEYKVEKNRDELEKKREKNDKGGEKFLEAIKDISDFFQEQIKIALEDFSFTLRAAERNIGAPISLSHEFVSASTLERIQEVIATQIAEVNEFADQIENEEFVGPLRPEMKSLVEEFRAQRIGRDQFIEDALSMRGIIFSDSGEHVALSVTRMNSIRSEFNASNNYGAQDRVVFVFRQATMHVHMTPERVYSPPSGEPALQRAPAPVMR